MAFPNSYPILADVKSYLRPNSTQALGSGDDALLTNLITAAIAFIEGPEGAGRAFEVTADTTRRFDALRDVDGRILYVDEDLAQITSVTNGDGVLVTSGQYVTNPRNRPPYYGIELKLGADVSWTYDDSPEDAIVIVGRWGYSIAAPPDIAQACIELVAWEYRRKGASGDVDRQVITASGSVIVPSSVPTSIMAVLKGYRRLA